MLAAVQPVRFQEHRLSALDQSDFRDFAGQSSSDPTLDIASSESASGSKKVSAKTSEAKVAKSAAIPSRGFIGGADLKRVYRVTAYCDRGVTASGLPSGVGQCAAPADIPLGAEIYIPALNQRLLVTDRTHKRFRHNTVDIFMPSKSACKTFGRKYLECHIKLPDKPMKYQKEAARRYQQRLTMN
jgi:3D (Asp-Asp-Asp) domain-containing protein